jgi:hypothetical protein
MKVSELTGHPENSKIYQETDLTDLQNSLSLYGQLEPIVITKNKKIISGHRRFAAIKSLEWDECDIRYIETDNEMSDVRHSNPRSLVYSYLELTACNANKNQGLLSVRPGTTSDFLLPLSNHLEANTFRLFNTPLCYLKQLTTQLAASDSGLSPFIVS